MFSSKTKMATLRRSKRVISSSAIVSRNKRARNSLKNVSVEGYNAKKTLGEETKDLLTQCFAGLQPSIWYRILPEKGKNDNIFIGCRQKMDVMLPLLSAQIFFNQKEGKIHPLHTKFAAFAGRLFVLIQLLNLDPTEI